MFISKPYEIYTAKLKNIKNLELNSMEYTPKRANGTDPDASHFTVGYACHPSVDQFTSHKKNKMDNN